MLKSLLIQKFMYNHDDKFLHHIYADDNMNYELLSQNAHMLGVISNMYLERRKYSFLHVQK